MIPGSGIEYVRAGCSCMNVDISEGGCEAEKEGSLSASRSTWGW